VGLEGRLAGSAVATGDDADTIAMVAVAIKA
jgi:ADP-ribosylglycohydrolase